MSQVPPHYTPQASFADLAARPITTAGLPGAEIDGELVRVQSSVNQAISRLSEIQRDDGALRNGVVGLSSFAPEVYAILISLGVKPTTWRTGLAFKRGDLISDPRTAIFLNVAGALTQGGSPYIIPQLKQVYADEVLLSPELVNGRAAYSIDGSLGGVTSGHACVWNGGGWTLGEEGSSWFSTADVATPNLVPAGAYHGTTNPDGWQPSAGSAGSPVVSLTGGVATPGTYLAITDHIASSLFIADLDKWATIASKPEAGDLIVDWFVADGVQTDFVLSVAPLEEVNTQVFINGLYQPKFAYALVGGNTISFIAVPPASAVVEVVSGIPAQQTIATVSDFSVSSNKIQALAVTNEKIADGAITNRTLAANSVGTSNIADGQITADKLSPGSVSADKLAAGVISAGNLADGSIIAVKLAPNSVVGDKIAAGAVSSAKMASGPLLLNGVTNASDPNHVVTKAWLERAGSVSGGMIVDQAVSEAKVATHSITPQKFSRIGNLACLLNQAVKGGTQILAAGGWDAVTDLSILTNRVNTTGKMRVQAVIHCASDSTHPIGFRILRNGTAVGTGNTSTSRMQAGGSGGNGVGALGIACVTLDFVDNMTGFSNASVLYEIQARIDTGTGYINRSVSDPDSNDSYRTISTLTLTELTG